MTSEDKRNIGVMVGLGILAYLIMRPSTAGGSSTTIGGDSSTTIDNGDISFGDIGGVNIPGENYPASVPGAWIPGINLTQIVYGPSGEPFIVVGGDTNVNIPDTMFGSLSRQYIPMFGLVGVTAVGAM